MVKNGDRDVENRENWEHLYVENLRHAHALEIDLYVYVTSNRESKIELIYLSRELNLLLE
jgi:hypothetical protein